VAILRRLAPCHQPRRHGARCDRTGVSAAYADGGQGTLPNTYFTELPGVIAQAPVQNAPAVATARNGQAIGTYVTNSNHGTWLFPPNQNQGNGS
jgi:hypothetical protein